MNSEPNKEGYQAGAANYWDGAYEATPNPYHMHNNATAWGDWKDGYEEGFSEMYDVDRACDCDICRGVVDEDE